MRRHIVIAVLVITALAGCSRGEKADVREATRGFRQEVQSAAESTRNAAANATLAGKVKTALLTRKGLDSTSINVEANGSVVTLKGDVVTRQQADIAEKVALATEGVTAVNNQLMLRIPAKPSGGTPKPIAPTGGR